jgi:hypothetical protein
MTRLFGSFKELLNDFGWALLIIAAVYLIERHKLWRRTFQIADVLLVLAAFGIAGIILTGRHKAGQAAKHEAGHKKDCDAKCLHSGEAVPKDCEDVLLRFGEAAKPAVDPTHPYTSVDISSGLVPKVDCFDSTTGKLNPNLYPDFPIVDCGRHYIAKPAGQCKRLVKGDIFDEVAHENGAIDCYLP